MQFGFDAVELLQTTGLSEGERRRLDENTTIMTIDRFARFRYAEFAHHPYEMPALGADGPAYAGITSILSLSPWQTWYPLVSGSDEPDTYETLDRLCARYRVAFFIPEHVHDHPKAVATEELEWVLDTPEYAHNVVCVLGLDALSRAFSLKGSDDVNLHACSYGDALFFGNPHPLDVPNEDVRIGRFAETLSEPLTTEPLGHRT